MADDYTRDFVEEDLECSSSSFDESSDETDEEGDQIAIPATQGDRLGVRPYLFEPEGSDDDRESNPENEAIEEPRQEIGGDEWCSCGNCEQMASQTECVCCRSIPNVMAKVDELNIETDQQLQCILQHPGFSSVCLDRYVLETAYYQYRQQYGERHAVDDNKRKRYTAYRQLARWCWGYLGKDVRVVLPSCAVCKIRETYPSHDYEGFQYAG